MQNQKTVTVAGGTIIVKELRVRDVRNFMADAKKLGDIDIKDLLLNRFDEAAALLKPSLDTGLDLQDLSFSEVEAVKDALLEVNQPFLNLLGLKAMFEAPTPSPTLTAPASALSSVDIQDVLNTAGASS